MPFLYETVKPTLVLYRTSDTEAAKLIAKRKGFKLLSLSIDGIRDPTVYDPVVDDNNLVCVGGWIVNPYAKHYFPELEASYDHATETMAPGPGVSEDGKRVIKSIMRPNGTTVTVVFGIHAEDTLQAAYEYTKVSVLPLVGMLAAEVVAAIAIAKVK